MKDKWGMDEYIAVIDVKPYASDMECFVPLMENSIFIPKDADVIKNRKIHTKKRQNRHLPELAFLILGTYFTAPFLNLQKL